MVREVFLERTDGVPIAQAGYQLTATEYCPSPLVE